MNTGLDALYDEARDEPPFSNSDGYVWPAAAHPVSREGVTA